MGYIRHNYYAQAWFFVICFIRNIIFRRNYPGKAARMQSLECCITLVWSVYIYYIAAITAHCIYDDHIDILWILPSLHVAKLIIAIRRTSSAHAHNAPDP